MKNALISIKPEYVRLILSGRKTVEIRSRSVKLSQGTQLWIYSTLPSGCLEAVATVELIKVATPALIWKDYGAQIGISQAAFRTYVNGSNVVSAILLQHVRELRPTLPLDVLRGNIQDFRPPQFFKRMDRTNPLFGLLKKQGVQLTNRAELSIDEDMVNRCRSKPRI